VSVSRARIWQSEVSRTGEKGEMLVKALMKVKPKAKEKKRN
jgi:hypothetical protein